MKDAAHKRMLLWYNYGHVIISLQQNKSLCIYIVTFMPTHQ